MPEHPSPDSHAEQGPGAWDVVIVGGGVAGLSAAIFTARADLSTLVVNHGASIVKRNAHLENYPGFPAGVNPRLLIEMMEDQAERNGADRATAKVRAVTRTEEGYAVETDESTYTASNVLIASWSDTSYLEDLDLELKDAGSKSYLTPDAVGRTELDGFYAAGRIAERYHQTVVNAGDGAKAALSLIEDNDPDFYHDWIAPKGYFTLRDREVPKGCEEIPREERDRRERESVRVMQAYFEEPYDADPIPHPSVEGEEGFDA